VGNSTNNNKIGAIKIIIRTNYNMHSLVEKIIRRGSRKGGGVRIGGSGAETVNV
jgi:hypothetical protein